MEEAGEGLALARVVDYLAPRQQRNVEYMGYEVGKRTSLVKE